MKPATADAAPVSPPTDTRQRPRPPLNFRAADVQPNQIPSVAENHAQLAKALKD